LFSFSEAGLIRIYLYFAIKKYVTIPAMIEQKTNIVIAGAGLVGLCFALCAKNSGFSIQIVETQLSSILSLSHQTHSRPISLSFGSVRILKALGVWEMLETHACPILSVHVSEQGRFGFTQFSASEHNVLALGYVVPYAKLHTALYQTALDANHITISSIETIKKIHWQNKKIHIQTNSSDFESDLFIAADGTQSRCRDLLGISFTEKEHDDIAMIFELTLSENHQHIAYERFTKHGVLAILPLHEKNKAQLVWTRKSGSGSEEVLAFLQSIFEGRLSIISTKKIAEFPLKTVIAEKQIAPNAVVLGNAAHTIYPLAAQGFNLGLQDASLLAAMLQNQKNIGDRTFLEKYESKAKTHQEKIICLTEQLSTLFALPFIGKVRGLGLLTTDLIHPIKNRLAKRTMGLGVICE
jgi:2-octaprenyl-6-methoxyphenol hydroxylase